MSDPDPTTTALGRLFGLLKAYSEASTNRATMTKAWSTALGVPEQRVALELAVVAAQVLPEADREATSSAVSFVREEWKAKQFTWSWPLLHPNAGLDLVAEEQGSLELQALGMLYTAAQATGGAEGRRPSEDQIEEWLVVMDQLRREVEQDDSLDPTFREALSRRIFDLMWALRHFDKQGPAGVQDAVSRILGSLVVHQAVVKPSSSNKWLAALVGVALTVSGHVMTNYSDYRTNVLAITEDATHLLDIVAEDWRDHLPKAIEAALPDRETNDADQQDEPPAA